jgi:hypothetical protein
MFFLGGLEDMIVFVVAGDRGEITKAASADLIKTFIEQEEFQFCRHHRGEAKRFGAGDLIFKNLTWRVRHRLMGVMIENIAEHHGGAFKPGQGPQGG